MNTRARRFAFVQMLGSAVVSQALLSAASFVVGLLLIRHTSDLQYGYYILASGAVLLLSELQGSFLNPPLVNRMITLDARARASLVGGLYRDQHRVLLMGGTVALLVAVELWVLGFLDQATGPLVVTTVAATIVILHRNFFRMVMLAHRRPFNVLVADAAYVVVLVAAVYVAIGTAFPAVGTILCMGIAAGLSGLLAARSLWRHEPWNLAGAPGILRAVAPLAAWSAGGAAIHWAFAQGYMYLAAGTLDLSAVSAIAATRLLMMPLNLLSSGIGNLMLPLTTGWLQHLSPAATFRRLSLFAAALVGVSLCYFAAVWLTRDWIFVVALKKQFAQRDALLLMWALAFLPMVVRDQLLYLLVARQRFHQLVVLTLASAVASLLCGYFGMLRLGATGAPLGVLIGELISLAGIIVLSLRNLASRQPTATGRPALTPEAS